MGLKMRVVDLAKVDSVDCRNNVATILKGKVAERMSRNKVRRIPLRQVQNVATLKSYVGTKFQKSP